MIAFGIMFEKNAISYNEAIGFGEIGLQSYKRKKNEKCREEVNTPEISLVVLQNVEEVNSQETFICIL